MNNNKVLVKLYVPKIEMEYDVMIPINKRINNVIPLLARAVRELTRGYYDPGEPPMLYDKSNAKMYDLKDTVKSAKIRNGTEIIMI